MFIINEGCGNKAIFTIKGTVAHIEHVLANMISYVFEMHPKKVCAPTFFFSIVINQKKLAICLCFL